MSSPVWKRRRYAKHQRIARRRELRYVRAHLPAFLALMRAVHDGRYRQRWVTGAHHEHVHLHVEHHDFPVAMDVNAPQEA